MITIIRNRQTLLQFGFIILPNVNIWNLQFCSIPRQHLSSSGFNFFSYSISSKMVYGCHFNLHFLDGCLCWALFFRCPCAIGISAFVNYYLRVFPPFLFYFCSIIFSLLICKSSFHIFNISQLTEVLWKQFFAFCVFIRLLNCIFG